MATDFRLKDQLPKLTQRIVQTYDEVGQINHLGHCPLPNYDEIIAATDDLKEILYPGYRRREGLHRGNVAYYVGDLVDRLHDRLTQQIGRALRHEAGATDDCDTDQDFEALGQAKTMLFLERLPELRKTAGDRRAGRLRRRPGLQVARRSDLLLPGPGGDHRLSAGPRAVRARHPVHPADDDRVGPQPHRHRHPPRREDRRALLHRSRHGRGDRRDDRDRRAREALSRRDARRAELHDRRRRQPRPRPRSGTRRSKTASSSTPTPRSSAAQRSSATTR